MIEIRVAVFADLTAVLANLRAVLASPAFRALYTVRAVVAALTAVWTGRFPVAARTGIAVEAHSFVAFGADLPAAVADRRTVGAQQALQALILGLTFKTGFMTALAGRTAVAVFT